MSSQAYTAAARIMMPGEVQCTRSGWKSLRVCASCVEGEHVIREGGGDVGDRRSPEERADDRQGSLLLGACWQGGGARAH